MAEIAEGCRAFDEDLSAWLDGELAAGRRREVGAHLEACARCAARVEALRAVDRALASVAAPAVAPDLRARLERRLAAERSGAAQTPHEGAAARRASRSARGRAPLRRRLAPIFVLSAAAAAAVALYLLARPAGLPGAPVEPAPVAKTPLPPQPEAAAPEAERQIAARPEPEPAEGVLESLDAEALAVALELDTIEDLPVIANLEALERMLRGEAG